LRDWRRVGAGHQFRQIVIGENNQGDEQGVKQNQTEHAGYSHGITIQKSSDVG